MIRNYDSERGSALVVTLLFTLFFFVIVNGLIHNLVNLKRSTETENISVQMKYIVESAAEISLISLRNNPIWGSNRSGILEGYNYVVTKKSESPEYYVFQISVNKNIKGTLYSRSVEMKVHRLTNSIVDWK